MKKQFRTIDEYIKVFPKGVRAILKKLRQTIRKEIPKSEEGISYGIPGFKLYGKYVLSFAGWKEHVSIYPIPKGDKEFEKQLLKYKKGKGTMQFSLDEPLPISFIEKAVKYLLRAHIERYKNKGELKICSRGHKFYKNNKTPVCPICWPGHYKKRQYGIN